MEDFWKNTAVLYRTGQDVHGDSNGSPKIQKYIASLRPATPSITIAQGPNLPQELVVAGLLTRQNAISFFFHGVSRGASIARLGDGF